MTLQRLEELELADIDLFDPGFAQNPAETYAAARKIHPWLARYQFGYILLDQASMKAVLRDDERCRTPNQDIIKAWNAEGTLFDRFHSQQLVGLAGAAHKRIRDHVAPAFTPRAANRHRMLMQEVLTDILDGLGDAVGCDFSDIASRYPITVMCSLIGVPREHLPQFVHWLDVQEAAFGQDASILPAINEALAGMLDYTGALIEQRRTPGEHSDDLLQSLVDLAAEGDRLTDEELRVLLVLLLAAGYDTTKNQLILTMKVFLDRPDIWQRVADDPNQAKAVIEESLRFLNVIGAVHRVTNTDIEHCGVLIPANTFLSIPLLINGRDASVNPNPDSFDPDRERITHISFGQGIHMCLGQFLARALLEEGIPIIAQRLRSPRPSGQPVYRSPMGIWGLRTLPIEFDRA